MVKYIVKKFVLAKVNDLLKDYSTKVGEVKSSIWKWIVRIEQVSNLFRSLLTKLEDNSIDEIEVDEFKQEIEKVLKEWL